MPVRTVIAVWPLFLGLSSADQLVFWRRFRERYPMVSLESVDLAGLVQQAKGERTAQLENELLRARWQLMDAEERAQEAELKARRAESRFRSRGYSVWVPPYAVPYHGWSSSTKASRSSYFGLSGPRIRTVDPSRSPTGRSFSSGVGVSRSIRSNSIMPPPGAFPNRAP